MVKIICEEDCGNAPKKLFLNDVSIAFAKGDAVFILDNVADDICWNIVGKELIERKDGVAEKLKQMKEEKTAEFFIESISTHGATGAVNGTRRLESGETYGFCDVYRFSSTRNYAKISKITSYVIAIS
ncbi:MAG: hypothetical protein J2P36_18305 [Ktedonobacteraceae bacterium]|nr:hypothetical protein [Ktedonobacteraceae bacterium]